MNRVSTRGVLAAAMMLSAAPAAATNGMRMIGFGPVQDSMGGVSVGAPLDAATIVTNPAGMAAVGRRADAAVTYFKPDVEFTATWWDPSPASHDAAQESNRGASWIPTVGVVYPLGDALAVGLGVVGVAGMGVDYDADLYMSKLLTSYMNLRVAPAVSYRLLGNLSVGVAVNLMYATMEWDAMGAMGNPTRDTSGAFGYGATVGVTFQPVDALTLGLAYETKSSFSDFEFDLGPAGTEKLEFDQPQVATVGASYRVIEPLLVAADVEWINWSDVAGKNQPKFTQTTPATNPWNMNWSDQVVVKIGAQYDVTQELKLRAGYNYGKMPLDAASAFENIAFPAVSEHHVTLGAGYTVGGLTVNLAGVWSPEAKISGANMPVYGISAYESKMSQIAADLGVSYKF